MKRMLLLLIFSAVMLSAQTKVGEGKVVKFSLKEDSVAVYVNSNFFDKEYIHPKKNLFSYKVQKQDTLLIFATDKDSLIEVYEVSGKNRQRNDGMLGDAYAFFNKNEKALEHYRINFNKNKSSYESYEKLIDHCYHTNSDLAFHEAEAHLAENPNNANVLYRNSLLLRDLKKPWENLIERGIALKDTSEAYFNILLTAIYETNIQDEANIKNGALLSTEIFFDHPDFIFLIYHITNSYKNENFDKPLALSLSSVLEKNISDEVRYYISSYFVDNGFEMKRAIDNLRVLLDNGEQNELIEYIMYSMAKGFVKTNEPDSAYFYISRNKKEFKTNDYDFLKLEFDVAKLRNDTLSAMESGVGLLTYDRKDKQTRETVMKMTYWNGKTLEAKIDEALEKESQRTPFKDAVLTKFDKSSVKFSKYKNKVVLIDFFATWCGPCRMEIKDLNKIKKDYLKEKKIAFIAVTSEDDSDMIEKFAKEREFEFDIYCDGAELMDRESIRGVPTVYLIDKKGDVRYVKVGFSEENEKYLRTRTDYLLRK